MDVDFSRLPTLNRKRSNILGAPFCSVAMINYLLNQDFTLSKTCFSRTWSISADSSGGFNFEKLFSMRIDSETIDISKICYSDRSLDTKFTFHINGNFESAYSDAAEMLSEWGAI